MADLTGDPANLQSEPLRSALTVELPPPRPSDPPRAVPPPAAVLSIDRLQDHHRLKTTLRADAELTLITRELERRPGNPGIVERFIAVLGAWASTRHALRLDQQARPAMDRAMAWALQAPCSSSYAFTVQRAVGILPSTDNVARVEHALAVHMTTPGAAGTVAGCLIQLADLFETRGDTLRARCSLEAALGLAAEANPRHRFRAQSRLLRILLTESQVHDAECLLDSIDASAFPLPTRHTWLNSCAAVAEARGDHQQALRLRLDAMALATETCGTEVLLEDLITFGRLRSLIPHELDADAEGGLIESARRLGRIAHKDSQWIAFVRRLTHRLIAGRPVDESLPETLRTRLLRIQQEKVAERLGTAMETPCEPLEPDAVRRVG